MKKIRKYGSQTPENIQTNSDQFKTKIDKTRQKEIGEDYVPSLGQIWITRETT